MSSMLAEIEQQEQDLIHDRAVAVVGTELLIRACPSVCVRQGKKSPSPHRVSFSAGGRK